MNFPYGETVTFQRPGVRLDKHGNEVPDPANPLPFPVDGVGVEPRPLPEVTQDARNAVTSGHTLYLREWVDVNAYDLVEVRGRVEQVDGDPGVWRNPYTGRDAGMVVQTKHYEG